jgi:ribosomal protein L16 Arg81 hydroxylase
VAVLHPADPDDPLTTAWTESIDPDAVEAAVASGHTVCVTDLSAGSPELAWLAASARRELGTIGEARLNAFLSSPGSGAQLHIDARVTTSLQVSGRKRWWYGAAPAVAWPRSNAQLLADGTPVWMFPWAGGENWERLDPPRPATLHEVVLGPGDLLCLPAGTWHAAQAIERCLALNLSFSPPDVPGLVQRLLERCLTGDERWRGALPPSPAATDGAPDWPAARSALAALLAEAADLLGAQAAALTGDAECAARQLWLERTGRDRHDARARA